VPADLAAAPLAQVALVVHDLAAATAFYRDILGVRFLFAAPNLAFFDAGGVRLMLSPPEGEFTQPGSVVYFQVADIGATHAELARRGVAFREAPHIVAPMPAYDLWMAFFRDPDGNGLALMSEVAR
jgi:catechol 2,3-dioxygenase-like lactoylglutathione lyase family enzyme